jgi:stalled ribosome rescue protein Dom34
MQRREYMKRAVGLWIDHKKALVVAMTDKGEEMKLIISRVEKQPGRYGGVRSTTSYKSRRRPADDRRQRKLTGQLNIYYDAVIACIRDAESILILGPGEAKGELQKRIKRAKLRGHVVGVETSDKMTDRQISAKIRQYFQEK